MLFLPLLSTARNTRSFYSKQAESAVSTIPSKKRRMSEPSRTKKQKTSDQSHHVNITRAIGLAVNNVRELSGGPFGCVIVDKEGTVVGEGKNCVTKNNDPTAHAEVCAIRAACAKLGTFQLQDCVLYTSCEPCPMCLGAIYWARIPEVVFSCSRGDAASVGTTTVYG
jgi:guanine deaminase